MDKMLNIVGLIGGLFAILAFLINQYFAAQKRGRDIEANKRDHEDLQKEIDTRVKSVCDTHKADMEKAEIERKHLELSFKDHMSSNEKEHSEIFTKMNNMAHDISEIKTGVEVLVAVSKQKDNNA